MARIERSKESLRSNRVVDADGADEVQLVTLEPKNWAKLCQQKVAAFDEQRQGHHFSVDQIIAEIGRLTQLQMTLEALQQAVQENRFPASDPSADPPQPPQEPTRKLEDSKRDLKTAYYNLYAAQGKLNSAAGDAADSLKQAVGAAQTALNTALEDYAATADAWVKYRLLTSGKSLNWSF